MSAEESSPCDTNPHYIRPEQTHLTAAGRTTHAQRLAADLGYDYVSATDILFEILRVPRDVHPWFNQADAISAAREDGAVDAELESRLMDLARTSDRVVFDSWALAWICPVPVLRIWIASDLPSRTRKCLVSLGDEPRPLAKCEEVLRAKDDYNRVMSRHRHGFDLFADRERYHAVLCNSHLIPAATRQDSQRGSPPAARPAGQRKHRDPHAGSRCPRCLATSQCGRCWVRTNVG